MMDIRQFSAERLIKWVILMDLEIKGSRQQLQSASSLSALVTLRDEMKDYNATKALDDIHLLWGENYE